MVINFEWDEDKNAANQRKHGVSFQQAQYVFKDPYRIIADDLAHSTAQEARYYCLGQVEGSVMTVRFVERSGTIRIIGAGYWRKGRRAYEAQKSSVH